MSLLEKEQLFYAPIAKNVFSVLPDFASNKESSLPGCSELNAGFSYKNNNGKKLVFVSQNADMPYLDLTYEQRIFQHGLIATRKNNWHDFFNAMVWHVFPKTKSAINAIHYRELLHQASRLRSRKRDLLTLFDESGVIIIANQKTIISIRNHDWQSVFVEQRNSWLNGDIQIITFGHALYEKYLNPYIGMTAHALFFDKDQLCTDTFLSSELLSGKILNAKIELSPLPLLGIPNWHKTQDATFYANKNYFR